MFAVVEMSGSQFKAIPGKTIVVDRMSGEEKDKITLDKVLLVQPDDKDAKIGDPYVKDAKVEATIKKHLRGEKVRVFKMKSKKRYRRNLGFKPELTEIEITAIKA